WSSDVCSSDLWTTIIYWKRGTHPTPTVQPAPRAHHRPSLDNGNDCRTRPCAAPPCSRDQFASHRATAACATLRVVRNHHDSHLATGAMKRRPHRGCQSRHHHCRPAVACRTQRGQEIHLAWLRAAAV